MELLDARRLVGPNALMDRPGGVVDLAFAEADEPLLGAFIARYRSRARDCLDALGWFDQVTAVRRVPGGVSVAASAPIDGLHTAVDLVKWAAVDAWDSLDEQAIPSLERTAARLRRYRDQDAQPELRALVAAARARGVPWLADGDILTLGYGVRGCSWPLDGLPAVAEVGWASLGTIPLGLVTGTNGKTTTTRLVGAMATAAHHTVGTTTTDGVFVARERLAKGDYAGPEGARWVLRHDKVDFAVLETARGGILRRGLAPLWAKAALITNIAGDHLEDFGVANLDELTAVKGTVSKALSADGVLVLNEDDPQLTAWAHRWRGRRLGFGSGESPQQGVEGCTFGGGELIYWQGGQRHWSLAIDALPIARDGAVYQGVNAAGAVALAVALELDFAAIERGLTQFTSADNPGRRNVFTINGATAILDYAHNPQGLRVLAQSLGEFPAGRRLLVMGQAGDRSDAAIGDFAREALATGPVRVIVKETPKLRRGRPPGEVPALIEGALVAGGLPREAVTQCDDEVAAVREALAWARAGDLLLLLIHHQREEVLALLREVAACRGEG
ncbi:MAG: Mur ligase family protein [Candidatus Competibacterales bacterium]